VRKVGVEEGRGARLGFGEDSGQTAAPGGGRWPRVKKNGSKEKRGGISRNAKQTFSFGEKKEYNHDGKHLGQAFRGGKKKFLS